VSRFRLWRHFDYVLLIVTALLTVYGVIMIYSANLGSLDEELRNLWRRQAILGGVGMGALLLLALFPRDYNWLGDFWWLAYLVALALLILVLFFGQSELTSVASWFNLGFINVQPSFLAMNLLTISAGSILVRTGRKRMPSQPLFGTPRSSITTAAAERPGLMNYLGSAAMTAILAALVFLQPDLGTALVLAAIWLSMMFLSGLPVGYMVLTVLLVVGMIIPLWELADVLQFGHMHERILGFLNPESNPDVVYQVRQALIAIGSGGFWGKGFAQGTQSQLRYLPVRHTDFIFAVIAEELGFLGVLVLFLLYLVLFACLLRVALVAADPFGRAIAAGALAIILFQVIINVGMNLGLLPVVGLPLPFISYGPAALITMMVAIGLAENVVMRHRRLEF
jgi:rod shape determining protein RodA